VVIGKYCIVDFVSETPGFVDVLFDALTSKVYLQSEVKVKEEPVDNVQEKPSSTTDEVQVKTEPKEVDTKPWCF
jgi:hypothetical protein